MSVRFDGAAQFTAPRLNWFKCYDMREAAIAGHSVSDEHRAPSDQSDPNFEIGHIDADCATVKLVHLSGRS